MSAIAFFREDQEQHRSRVPIDAEKQKGVADVKRHLTDFLALKEQARQYGIGLLKSYFAWQSQVRENAKLLPLSLTCNGN